jgi:hypothetical protein
VINKEKIWKEEVLSYFRADLLFGTLLGRGRKPTSDKSYSSCNPCPDSNRMLPDPSPSIFVSCLQNKMSYNIQMLLTPPFIIIQPVFFHS